jgi:RNA-directed DNA polymerase
MWWEQAQLDLVGYRAKYDRQHRRFCRAIQGGDRKEIRRFENWLLKSHTAKTLAVAHAAKKKKYPLYTAKLDMMASMLSCWERPTQPVTLYLKKKSNGGHRPIFKYGVMWAAQQYLVVWLLAPRLRLHAGQYGVSGKDRTAAVERAKQLIAGGYDWVIRGDITNCFPSMNGEAVLARLPGPPAVLRQALLPPPMECITYPYGYALHTLKARQGLPPGAASTPLVVAAALAPVLDGLPGDVVVILYVDDFAIFASSKAAAVSTMNALREALWAAPVGDLQLKFCNIHHVAEGFGFLGYHIFRNGSGGATARPSQAALEKLYEQLEAVETVECSDPLREKLNKAISWRCAYAAWEGDELTDDVLFVVLSNHFPPDCLDEELIPFLHSKAQITRKKCLPP